MSEPEFESLKGQPVFESLEEHPEAYEVPAPQPEVSELLEVLVECMNELKPEERAIVAAKFIEGMTWLEIGKLIGKSAYRARMRGEKGLRKLRHPTRLRRLCKFFRRPGEHRPDDPIVDISQLLPRRVWLRKNGPCGTEWLSHFLCEKCGGSYFREILHGKRFECVDCEELYENYPYNNQGERIQDE